MPKGAKPSRDHARQLQWPKRAIPKRNEDRDDETSKSKPNQTTEQIMIQRLRAKEDIRAVVRSNE